MIWLSAHMGENWQAFWESEVMMNSWKANPLKKQTGLNRLLNSWDLLLSKRARPIAITLMMPNYIGSVRAMVVAGIDGAYGIAEKAVPVKKPLMVLATLPRVLGPVNQLNYR